MKRSVLFLLMSLIMVVFSACGGASSAETDMEAVTTGVQTPQVATYTAYYDVGWGEDPRVWAINGVFAEGEYMPENDVPIPLRVFYVTEENTVTLLQDLYPGDYAYVGAFYLDEYGNPEGDYSKIEPYGHFAYGTIDDENCTLSGGYYEDLPKGTWFFGSVCFSDSFFIVVGDYGAAQDGTVPKN